MQKTFSHASNADVSLLAPTAISLVKILFNSPNPTINSIVVSFLNSLHSHSSSSESSESSSSALKTSYAGVLQSVAQEASSFIQKLDAKQENHSFTVFQLAILSSLMEIQLARETVDQNVVPILSYLSSLFLRHVCFLNFILPIYSI